MPSRRQTLPAVLTLCLVTLAFPLTAGADAEDAFIELSVGDLTDVEIWDDSHFCGDGDVYYNRVDGLLVYFGLQYYSDIELHPRIRALLGWPSAHGRSYYRLDVEQPLFGQDSFSFGVNLYDKSSWSLEDAETIGDFDNNVHALFARIDERDYYREEGGTFFVQQKVTPEFALRGEYRSARMDSLSELEHVWTIFNGKDDWRENPALEVGVLGGARPYDGGRMASLVWSAEYDGLDPDGRTGWWARGIAEYSGDAAGSDYDYRKHTVEARKMFALTPTQSIDLYGQWGIGSGDDFPSHKLFHLGGRGRLRGYDLKEFAGKDIIFGRAEYGVQMTESMEMIFFLEGGEVGYGTTTPDSDDSDGHKEDMGIGFRMGSPWEGWMRLDVARAFEEDADIKVYLSLLVTH